PCLSVTVNTTRTSSTVFLMVVTDSFSGLSGLSAGVGVAGAGLCPVAPGVVVAGVDGDGGVAAAGAAGAVTAVCARESVPVRPTSMPVKRIGRIRTIRGLIRIAFIISAAPYPDDHVTD